MRSLRVALIALGLICVAWGVRLMTEFDGEQSRSAVVWLLGGVVVHDAVLAPLTIAVGWLATRRVVPGLRRQRSSRDPEATEADRR